MNRRAIVIGTGAISAILFAGGGLLYGRYDAARRSREAAAAQGHFVRAHSPVIGRPNARVTIVEFFDPSCEPCRAFYPAVKEILSIFPEDVRLVIRYAPFHEGSDEAARILETARLQGLYIPVLEALLINQPKWAIQGGPRLDLAWEAARSAGLDVARALREMSKPEIHEILRQDMADIRTANVRGTPTFFVNERPLLSSDVQQLYGLVRTEVERARASR